MLIFNGFCRGSVVTPVLGQHVYLVLASVMSAVQNAIDGPYLVNTKAKTANTYMAIPSQVQLQDLVSSHLLMLLLLYLYYCSCIWRTYILNNPPHIRRSELELAKNIVVSLCRRGTESMAGLAVYCKLLWRLYTGAGSVAFAIVGMLGKRMLWSSVLANLLSCHFPVLDLSVEVAVRLKTCNTMRAVDPPFQLPMSSREIPFPQHMNEVSANVLIPTIHVWSIGEESVRLFQHGDFSNGI
ncbi:unnamed protein product [Ilex paraguariensis]|uniref:Uncharacterized protein n=1 Tax=Ilex paraguariensis TaxID=185542 RepID=A0ABC8TWM5_9AQUA